MAYVDHEHEYFEDYVYYYDQSYNMEEEDCLDWCANQTLFLEWTRYSACEYWGAPDHYCYLYGNNELPITGGDGKSYAVCFAFSKDFRIFQIPLLLLSFWNER